VVTTLPFFIQLSGGVANGCSHGAERVAGPESAPPLHGWTAADMVSSICSCSGGSTSSDVAADRPLCVRGADDSVCETDAPLGQRLAQECVQFSLISMIPSG